MQSKTYELLIESREEYTRQYVSLTRALYIQGFESIWETMRAKKRQVRFYLCDFQRMLSKIPEWSQLIIDQEADRFVQTTRCDWLEDLVKAIYVVNVKILSYVATRRGVSKDRLKVEVPTLGTFIHRSYITMARALWKKPMLMFSTSEVDRLANREELERLVEEGVRETVRESLPFKDILGHLFQGGDATESETVSEAVSEAESVMRGGGRRRREPSVASSVSASESEDAASEGEAAVTSEHEVLSDYESDATSADEAESIESLSEEEKEPEELTSSADHLSPSADHPMASVSAENESVDEEPVADAAPINIDDIMSAAVPVASTAVPVPNVADTMVPIASVAGTGVPVASVAGTTVPIANVATTGGGPSETVVAPIEQDASMSAGSPLETEPFDTSLVTTPLDTPSVTTPEPETNTDPFVKTVIYDPPAARPRSRLHGADKVRSILGVHMSPREVVENKDHLRRTLLRRFAEL